MTIKFRNFTNQPGYTDDFHRVCDFLIRVNRGSEKQYGMLWVRWEWAFAKGIQDKVTYEKIGIWEEYDEIKAVAMYEERPGRAWLITAPLYGSLKQEMLSYARENLRKDGRFQVSVDDNDRAFQQYLLEQGFHPTQEKEQMAVFDITAESTRYALPENYRIASLADEFDMRKYNRVMWHGFDHEGLPPEDDAMLEWRRNCVTSPHSKLDLNLVAVAPDGEFVSHCGIWYQPDTDYAVVEPVATHPQYRRMGLGEACVLEAAARCGKLGAGRAFVGSSQQFYYAVGFAPCSNETFWEHE